MANEVKKEAVQKQIYRKLDGIMLDGIMFTEPLMCVQLGKKFIDKENEKGDYYYNLTFSDGQEILSCTCGAQIGDKLSLMSIYRLGLVYQNPKVKIVDFELMTTSADFKKQ